MEVYMLDGTERIEVRVHKVPCGDLTETEYFNTAGESVRKDINVAVTLAAMLGATTGV